MRFRVIDRITTFALTWNEIELNQISAKENKKPQSEHINSTLILFILIYWTPMLYRGYRDQNFLIQHNRMNWIRRWQNYEYEELEHLNFISVLLALLSPKLTNIGIFCMTAFYDTNKIPERYHWKILVTFWINGDD